MTTPPVVGLYQRSTQFSRHVRGFAAWTLAAVALLWVPSAFAQDVQGVPLLSASVVDETDTLDEVQQAALVEKLASIEKETGSQIVVLLVATTQPEDIAAYSQRVADTWKIGRRGIGDGLLIVVAKGDRRVRIEVAKALEGAIPDLAAKRVIDSQITPAFRADDYAGGLNSAVDQLAALIRGEGLPAPDQRGAGGENVWDNTWALMFFAFFGVAPFVVRLFGRRWGSLLASLGMAALGWWLTASLVVCVVAGLVTLLFTGVMGLGMAQRGWSNGGSSGSSSGGWGGGGSGSGGGFSSGGGGDFGGGGASGRW
jgi:uncharacterized protein